MAKRVSKQLVLVLCLLLPCLAFAANKAYVALNAWQRQVSSFYPIMVAKETPYLPLRLATQFHFGFKLSCNRNKTRCVLRKIQGKQQYLLNRRKAYLVKSSGQRIRLPSNALLWHKHQIWLRYDLWQRWLPWQVQWSLQQYRIFISPKYKSLAAAKEEREIQLHVNERREERAKRLAKMPAITPQQAFNAQLRYRIDWSRPLMQDQQVNAQFDTTADILRGTFNASGSVYRDNTGTTSNPIFWSYRLHPFGSWNRLQIGDTFVPGSLLLGSFNLRDGITISRLLRQNNHAGFIYQGTTLPGTEVDVYRNDVLFEIIRADSNGIFNVNYPNAVNGDVFKFNLFFKDGRMKTETVHMAESDASLLNVHQWDAEVNYGRVASTSLNSLTDINLASGPFLHADGRYGITKSLTLGIDSYHFPFAHNAGAAGLDGTWQTTNVWNNQFETIRSNAGTDYGYLSDFSGFDKQQWQFRLRHVADNSPVANMNQPALFTAAPIDLILQQPKHMWQLKDIIDFERWQIVPEYQHTDNGELAGVSAYGSLTPKLSVTMDTGVARPDLQGHRGFVQSSFFYIINPHNTLQLTQTWLKGQDQTQFYYRYQSLREMGWDAEFGYNKSPTGVDGFAASLQYRATKSLAASIQATPKTISLQLSLLGLESYGPGPSDYDDYATGSVSGRVAAPPINPGSQAMPLEGIKVTVGPKSARTDKNGRYLITGLPTNVRLQAHIDAESLDAAYLPAKGTSIIELRQATVVNFNPKIVYSAGLDGTVHDHGHSIKAGTKIALYRDLNKKPIATTLVEDNGFFTMNKIPSGHYYLRLLTANSPIKAVDLKPSEHWLAGVNYYIREE